MLREREPSHPVDSTPVAWSQLFLRETRESTLFIYVCVCVRVGIDSESFPSARADSTVQGSGNTSLCESFRPL